MENKDWVLRAGMETFPDEDLLNMILGGSEHAGYCQAVLQDRQALKRDIRRHNILRKTNKFFNNPANQWREQDHSIPWWKRWLGIS